MSEQRVRNRYAVKWQAWCTGTNGSTARVTIVDCSEGNFGIKGQHPFAAGDGVTLNIDNVGEFPCRVIWSKDDRFALHIVDDTSDAAMADLKLMLDTG